MFNFFHYLLRRMDQTKLLRVDFKYKTKESLFTELTPASIMTQTPKRLV